VPKISVVTPFYGPTEELILDFRAAVRGAEVIVVDNATPEPTAAALADVAGAEGWIYQRNEQNAGFAGGNNQGYARATGDVIVFLNSDVAAPPAFLAAMAADVRDGALYGPSLQAQLVGGCWLPYLEGWCVAATRATWRKLGTIEDGIRGPWDQDAFPGPYWEDNDLCYRAALAGVSLIQTAWPIQHKGGRSAGGLERHRESLERNRRTFSERVLAHAVPAPTPTTGRYLAELSRDSDIRHHLPLLASLARGNVVELGTRGGASTIALLAGVERRGGKVLSVDIEDCSAVAGGHPAWAFLQGSSTDERTLEAARDGGWGPIDVLLIDTEHTVEQVAAELALWAPHVAPGGTICLHDPETFPGVRRAIEDYTRGRADLAVTYVLPNNGMAVIEKRGPNAL
jgi:glycosyltransferase involved in cell wall biosynthesis